MIDFRQILTVERTCCGVAAPARKSALALACERIARSAATIKARGLLEGLLARERLGSTGLGEGVAIPHCRHHGCQRPVAAFLAMTDAIDFDAPDDSPVDLLFVLAVPVEEDRRHLEILGALARVFDDPGNLMALRRASNDQALFEALQGQLTWAQQQ